MNPTQKVIPGNQTQGTSTQTPTINKNPLALKSFEDRGKAISDKVSRIKANPAYQKLSPDLQKKVLSGVYHKYVVPAYGGAGYGIPQHDVWVSGAKDDVSYFGRKSGDTFHDNAGKKFGADALVSGTKALDEIEMFGIKINRKGWMAMHGLENHFANPILNKFGLEIDPKIAKGQYGPEAANEKAAQRVAQNIQQADYFLQSHPRKGFINNLGSFAGEFAVQLPIYEAVGAGRALVGAAGRVTFDGMPLTQKLAASPVGKFVAKRIGEATDGFISSLVTSGGSKTEAVSGAVGFAAMGAVGAGAGKVIKIVSAPLIKKWTANTIAMGGMPLAQEVAESVMAKEAAVDSVVAHKGLQPLELHDGISIHPETEEKGKILFKDPVDGVTKEFTYSSAASRQQIYHNVSDIAQSVRSKFDPVLYQLEDGERAALNSISMSKYSAPFSRLTPEQRVVINTMRHESIQQAAAEAPVHLPELTHAEAVEDVSKQVKTNPIFAKNIAFLKSMGIDVAAVSAGNEIEQTAIDTGIKDSIATQSKVGRSRNSAITEITKKRNSFDVGAHPEYDAMSRKHMPAAIERAKTDKSRPVEGFLPHTELEKEMIEGMTGETYNADKHGHLARRTYQVNAEQKRLEKGVSINASNFGQHLSDTIAYFKQPRNRIKFNKDIGNVAKTNFNEFYEELRKADGDRIRFENPYHRLLYHFGNRRQLPEELNKRLMYEIRKVDPKKTAGLMAKEADWLHIHLLQMARSGRLVSEGNIFASSKFGGSMQNWTPYMKELTTEVDKAQLDMLSRNLKRHPEALAAVKTTYKQLSALRLRAKTAEDWLEVDRKLQDNFNATLTRGLK